MSNVDKKDENNCGPTHHLACECREKMWEELDKTYHTYLGKWVQVHNAAKLQMTNTKAMLDICKLDLKVIELRNKLGLEGGKGITE